MYLGDNNLHVKLAILLFLYQHIKQMKSYHLNHEQLLLYNYNTMSHKN